MISPPWVEADVNDSQWVYTYGSPAGGGALTLDVYGANFISGAVVRWNGSNRTTTRLSSTHLQASIPAADVTQPGTSSVTVFNSAPGGGTSNAVSYDVAAPGQNPAPSITSISPEWVFSHGAASSQITLVVNGVNFVEGSTVQLDGVDGSGGYHNRPTKFVSSTQLQATITGGDLFSPGTAGISVTSPAPGGGTSNVVTFTIKPLWQLFVPFVKR